MIICLNGVVGLIEIPSIRAHKLLLESKSASMLRFLSAATSCFRLMDAWFHAATVEKVETISASIDTTIAKRSQNNGDFREFFSLLLLVVPLGLILLFHDRSSMKSPSIVYRMCLPYLVAYGNVLLGSPPGASYA